ncbi:MAG TPA: thioesterase family protein [Chloroflexia bacterium]|jgi:acyl-CoA thioester hydrolase
MSNVTGEDKREISHTFRVRYAETDAMGIVHHSSYVIWLEMGRTEFMRAFGFTYRELEEMGVVMPVLEIGVRYRQPAYYDDELRISTWVDELSRTKIKLAYKIVRTSDGKLLTEGFSLHTFTGHDGRLIRITHHLEAWSRLRAMSPHLDVKE